jgi:hypothetical protein
MWIVPAEHAGLILLSAVSHNVLLIKRACIARPKRLHGSNRVVIDAVCVRDRWVGLRFEREESGSYFGVPPEAVSLMFVWFGERGTRLAREVCLLRRAREVDWWGLLPTLIAGGGG